MKYTKEILELAVTNSTSYTGVLRHLNAKTTGSMITHISKQIRKFEIDISHFTGSAHTKGKTANNRKSLQETFIILPDGSHRDKAHILKRALLQIGVEYKCNICGIDSWLNKPISLQIDHVDGNCLNNLQSNLRFLCPNCHYHTDTWGNKTRPLVAQSVEAVV